MAAENRKPVGPDHPITIAPSPGRVRVMWQGKVVAQTEKALDLKETTYPVVHYIPRADVDMSLLAPSAHQTYCPYKGHARYFSLVFGDRTAENAVWSYENPYEDVAPIKDYVAFYPDRVDAIEEG
jgi:uncharacterized protein (DUF427 family)